jgi:hypothetical protein
MKSIRAILATFAAGLLLAGCSLFQGAQTLAGSSPSPAVIAQARNTVLGLDNLYGIAVNAADKWAQPKNRCGVSGAPPAPLCSTLPGIIAVNKGAVAIRTALNDAEGVVMKASPQQSDLDLAVSTAQTVWAAYQTILAQFSIKTGG